MSDFARAVGAKDAAFVGCLLLFVGLLGGGMGFALFIAALSMGPIP